MYDMGVINGEVYIDNQLIKTNLYLKSGKIEFISQQVFPAKEILDASDLWVFPGLIDPHVHLALQVGRFRSRDDFKLGGYEAARGGITMIIDFLDPILTDEALEPSLIKRLKQAEECPVDYAFHATLGNYTGDVDVVVQKSKMLGLAGIKVFTTYKESNRMIPTEILKQLLDKDFLTLVHAEADHLVDSDFKSISNFEDSRPLEAELEAIRYLLSHLGIGRLYIVHTSSGSAVELLKDRENVFIESCPQYFEFDKSVYSSENGALYLLAPPLRSIGEREKLIAGFNGIHSIGTDHCPFTDAEKLAFSDASKIPKGIEGLRYSFLVLFNYFGLRAVDKMTRNVSKIFGLSGKGAISVGKDADLMIFDPNDKTVGQGVYEGKIFKGKIVHTLSRGAFVLKFGDIESHKGRFIRGGNR